MKHLRLGLMASSLMAPRLQIRQPFAVLRDKGTTKYAIVSLCLRFPSTEERI